MFTGAVRPLIKFHTLKPRKANILAEPSTILLLFRRHLYISRQKHFPASEHKNVFVSKRFTEWVKEFSRLQNVARFAQVGALWGSSVTNSREGRNPITGGTACLLDHGGHKCCCWELGGLLRYEL